MTSSSHEKILAYVKNNRKTGILYYSSPETLPEGFTAAYSVGPVVELFSKKIIGSIFGVLSISLLLFAYFKFSIPSYWYGIGFLFILSRKFTVQLFYPFYFTFFSKIFFLTIEEKYLYNSEAMLVGQIDADIKIINKLKKEVSGSFFSSWGFNTTAYGHGREPNTNVLQIELQTNKAKKLILFFPDNEMANSVFNSSKETNT
jgi:hypothetical protein